MNSAKQAHNWEARKAAALHWLYIALANSDSNYEVSSYL
jgi:hypothetical protein